MRRAPARSDQRRARPLEDRGRADGHRERRRPICAQVAVDLRYVIAERRAAQGAAVLRPTIDPGRAARASCSTAGTCARCCSTCSATRSSSRRRARCGCDHRAGQTATARLRFDVVDTGIGIEAEELSAVFQAFAQTSSGAAPAAPASGLTISHRLVRGMGGELQGRERAGQGQPLLFRAAARRGRGRSRRGSGRRPMAKRCSLDARLAPGEQLTALVVDDSTVNRRILASLLESAGVRVITAAGGLEAVELARDAPARRRLHGPEDGRLDGLEATRRLAADEATAAIPVIAVTASAWASPRRPRATPAASTICRSRCGPRCCSPSCSATLGVRFVSPSGRDGAPATPLGSLTTMSVRATRRAPSRGGRDRQRHRPRCACRASCRRTGEAPARSAGASRR